MPKFFKKNLLVSPNFLPKPEPLLMEHAEDGNNLPPTQPQNPTPTPQPTYDDDDYFIRDLVTWTAPARPYRKKDRSFFTTALVLVVLISLISFLIGTPMLAAALFALLFVVFMLDYVPPEEIEYKISSQGITIHNHFYHWYDLDSFWIGEKDGHEILYIRTLYRFPSLLMLVLNPEVVNQAKRSCAQFLPFVEIPPKTMIDNWATSLQKHFPLETPKH